MPRANRYFLPGHVWHITHRCHQKEFLLKFARDRQRWMHWLFEARKRYDLCVLNFIVTSNHIHLLVMDTGNEAIPHNMQLIAGRTAQEYNLRKHRKGAFWEDRYHATAIQSDEHFLRCLTYIDMNMVRAGKVRHPRYWSHSGFHEIQAPPERYRIIDQQQLLALSGFTSMDTLRQAHLDWIDEALQQDQQRDARWTEGIAVGQKDYVEQVQISLGSRASARSVVGSDAVYELKEERALYLPLSA